MRYNTTGKIIMIDCRVIDKDTPWNRYPKRLWKALMKVDVLGFTCIYKLEV